ncbi:MAG: Uncharacterized protein XD95_0444 [Microgenomates bacterium 39_7]|nr:MAG: Uncharacterized protein XD95_0444 [Microgenomates bacterium 39_7]
MFKKNQSQSNQDSSQESIQNSELNSRSSNKNADSLSQPPSSLKIEKSSKTKNFNIWPKRKSRQILLILFLLCCVFLGAVAVLTTYTYNIGRQVLSSGNEMVFSIQTANDQFKQQNLPGVEQQLLLAQEQLTQLSNQYQQLAIYNKLPWIKNYYQDGISGLTAAEHGLKAAIVAVKAITPYADVLGFEGEGSFEGGTTEDRIALLLQTLEMVTPELDEIESLLIQTEEHLSHINPERYPEKLRDVLIRDQIAQAQSTISQSIIIFQEFRPVVEQLPTIAGSSEPKKYLMLFQNNNELRPTGGFLTAYSIINLDEGKVIPEKSDDIYELDRRFNERIPIPESLGKYLTTERYWNLRDMNISPDFKKSMDTFFEHYQKVKGEPDDIDGIIAIDTHVLTRLLEILGPVELPGYGTFSAEIDPRCDCPQVVYALSEIITKPTPYLREDRKGVLGPMMQAILIKTYGAPRQHFSELFELVWNSIQGKNLQMYFVDDQLQLAAENAGAAGRMKAPEQGDFLAIVDANLGGAKSNLFTESEVLYLVDGPDNGFITATLEITYRNSRKADNCNLEAGQLCLNAPAPTWNRLYLPSGSQLIDALGFSQEPTTYEELGLLVIDGFFTLDPLGMAKIRVSYQVPYELPEYQLSIWKQGGVKPYKMIVDVNGNQAELLIDRDTTYEDRF